MGNPSDGFNGKTISLSIKNFWAEVTIFESARLILIPHPLNDPTEFGSLADLHDSYGRDGYLGGLRLLQATCKKFYQASFSCPTYQNIVLGRVSEVIRAASLATFVCILIGEKPGF